MFRQQRVVIEKVSPQLNHGEFYVKRIIDDKVQVTADVLGDGHDIIQAELLFSHENARKNTAVRMRHMGNDLYQASFQVDKQGFFSYQIRAWVDYALNWQHGIKAKLKDGQHVKSELLDGVQYLRYLEKKVPKGKKAKITSLIESFARDEGYENAVTEAVSNELYDLFIAYPSRLFANKSKKLRVYVDRKKAAYSTWYEFFPRSSSKLPGQHGTFKDCERILPKIAKMGFDTLYFPPIHPIGKKNRKGKNNSVDAKDSDSGVPWAIGSDLGGHKSIHPQLGSEKDFKALIKKANTLEIEIAMDIAFQAAPDHPYLSSNPQWFRKRPDGTIQYAENPPKKYQDIDIFLYGGLIGHFL